MHAPVRGLLPQPDRRRPAARRWRARRRSDALLDASRRRDRRASSSSRWCRAPAACCSTTRQVLRRLRALADRHGAAADLRRDLHRLRPHRHDVRLFEEAGVVPDIVTLSKALTGGTLPLRRNDRAPQSVRGVLVGRSGAGADARPDLHGQPARLRRRQRLARSVRARAAARSGGQDRGARCAAAWPCRELPGVKEVRVKGAIGVVELERIDDLNALRQRFVEEGVFIRPFGTDRLSDAGLHHRRGRTCKVHGCGLARARRQSRVPKPGVHSVADGRAVQIVGVGALDLHGRDLADAERPVARDKNGAVDLRRVAFAAALRNGLARPRR